MGAGRVALIILYVFCVTVEGKLEIINENDTAEREFPFLARLFRFGRSLYCGASLIRPNIALTAAHCVARYSDHAEYYSVVVGEHFGSETSEFEQEIGVERIIIHEDFGYRHMLNYDIALLVLDEEVELREGIIETIPIARNDLYYKEGTNVTLIYFQLDQNGECLEKFECEVANQTDCQTSWEEEMNFDLSFIFENKVCTICPEHYKSEYKDDSGAPVFIKNKDKFTQMGLVSKGQLHSEDFSYNMFTDTHFFLDWVVEKVTEIENKTVSDYIEIVEIKPKMKKISGTDYKKGKVNCKVEQLSQDINMESQVLVGLFSVVDGKVNYLDAM